MTKFFLFFWFLFSFSVTKAQSIDPRIFDQLSSEQRMKVLSGEQVYATEKIADAPWPQITIFQLIKATPEECAAVSLDYELKPQYSHEFKSAKISKSGPGSQTEVDYLLSVLFLPDEEFTLRYDWSTNEARNQFDLEWSLVRAKRMKKSWGRSIFTPHKGNTLLITQLFTDPGIFGARLFAGKATSQTLEVTDSLVKQIEHEHFFDRQLLEKQIQAIRN